MSKRRINKQQLSRIEKNQQTYQETKEHNHDALADGLVITRYSRHVEIEDNEGKRIRCSIRPNLDTLVAGDRIIWQTEGDNQGVVVSLYPRGSTLARPTSAGLKKPVAANITQMIIVIAPKPEISWALLDSYLIMAETLHLHAVILLNKTDLPCDELKAQLLMDYQSLSYPIVMVSKNSSLSFNPLKSALNNQISVFVGQSGVGKSSIIAEILPHEGNIATQEISLGSELGRHTTSNSRYYHLPSGGALIDSPGVREFSLWDIDTNIIAHGYIEFKPYLSQCKFRNCTHINTPHCAIIAALNRGNISMRRYENFIKLCAQFSKTKF
ncbi:putative ribosome biogenesis GTPase RsgA [Legionella antarctica]|uniref:Small ribosomal subunit biogenesis GTPase RsgA n=1 Tax=Legionella antarctica TaxID=2708020 RepID=A0A6F8T8P4_9GAMM|nr:small ribosomal subunit biogenesis GTPase RsgA [Legionella antarctica]BCA96849.1 putative ribosome biogenesis GTPase RsgA [Legionella antarctica]